jgi:hypothetical protein
MTHQAPQCAHSAHPEGLCERGVARGTFKTNHYGIEFFYRNTLDRDWLTPCPTKQVSIITVWVGKAEPNKRSYYREKVTFEKSAHPSANSRPQRLVEHTANKFRLVPRNIMLAGLEILTGCRATDLVGKQCDQMTIDWYKSRQRPQPRHLRVKRSRQIRTIG